MTKLLFVLLLSGCTVFGTLPDEKYRKRFKSSPNYDKKEEVFLNRKPRIVKDLRKDGFTFAVIKEWFQKGIERVPEKKLPEVKPDLAQFMKLGPDIKVIWFGHSTFLLNLQGKIILVDPVFSGSAAPVSFLVKRFQKPVLELKELPKIDFLVISHDHYDHLDMESIKFFTKKDVRFLVPLGVGSHLIGWGIKAERITELDWWGSHQVDGLEFVATPAQHFSGRDGRHQSSTLWASWVIKSQNHKIYFSGDSGYDTHFKDIGEKYGPFDLAFIENGQYNEKWRSVHLLPEESVKAYFDLKAKRFFPVHWGMFQLAFHSWDEPILKLQSAAEVRHINLVSPRLGEVVTVNETYENKKWWLMKQ